MIRRFVLVTALAALALGQPAPALARDCEDICADKAVERCEDLDSVKYRLLRALSASGGGVTVVGDDDQDRPGNDQHSQGSDE